MSKVVLDLTVVYYNPLVLGGTLMADIVRALAISGGLLLLVVILIVFISIAAVNRGAAAMGHAEHPEETAAVAHKEAATTPAAKTAASKPAAAKPAAPAKDEINVLQILAFGTGLFVLAVLGLFALSLIEHM
jgi:hypothetical protein